MEIAVAPMLDLTTPEFRYFFRQMSKHTHLYTEMIPLNAIVLGDADRFLAIDDIEKDIALQIGGSDPARMAQAVRIANRYGYDEINLNAGCPSERVAGHGDFGASLMKKPALTCDLLKAMLDNTDKTVSLKTRIAFDNGGYDEMSDYVGACAAAGCSKFIIHARNVRLNISPKANRSEKMILHYEMVYRLKKEFQHLRIIVNGDIKSAADIAKHGEFVDGVMIGRAAYYNPCFLADTDYAKDRIITDMIDYAERKNMRPHGVFRHMIGLFYECRGAKTFKRLIADNSASDAVAYRSAFHDFISQIRGN